MFAKGYKGSDNFLVLKNLTLIFYLTPLPFTSLTSQKEASDSEQKLLHEKICLFIFFIYICSVFTNRLTILHRKEQDGQMTHYNCFY